MHQLTSLTHFHEVISSHEVSIILFFKASCPLCEQFIPVFDRVAESVATQNYHFYRINLREQSEIAAEVLSKGDSVPKSIIYRSGTKIASCTSVLSPEEFEEWIASSISTNELSTKEIWLDKSAVSVIPQITCTGMHENRRPCPSMFWRRRKAFYDPEPNCTWTPTPEDIDLQIGRVNEGDSYYSIIMGASPDDCQGTIYFRLEFVSDPVEKARFQSAMFSVTFTEIVGENGLMPLNIRDLFPKYEGDLMEKVLYTNSGHINEEVDSPSGFAATYTGDAITYVRGQGIHSPTAVWSFSENQASGPHHGLNAQYELLVSLPVRQRIRISFWAKAMLVKDGAKMGLGLGPNKMLLRIGSNETPYERIIRLG